MTAVLSSSEVVGFWKAAGPDRWYKKSDVFDDQVRAALSDAHFSAARRTLDGWMEAAEGALALLILLDQVPRNIFRGSAHQFATDPLARTFCKAAIACGYPALFEAKLRQFLLMPLMHSEDVADQDALLLLVADMPETLKFAHIHRDIIVRFGRFPHRNRALGRDTTADEQAFLNNGGFSG